MQPYISVIICTYNRSRLLNRALMAFESEKGVQCAELVVVDNNSNDDTETVVRRCTNLLRNVIPVTYVHEPVQGLSRARNTGITIARGEILTFLDDDAVPRHDWLLTLLNAANEAPNRFVVGSVGYAQTGGYWGLVLWAIEFSGIHPYIPDGEVQGGASANMLVPREAIRQVSGFNERFTASEDSLLAADLRELGLTNWFCAAARGGHFNVTGMRHCLGHLRWLGYWGALCRRVHPLRGALAVKFWPFAAGLWAAKFLLTYYRVFRWGRGHRLRFLALAPGILLGLFSWNLGFLHGLSKDVRSLIADEENKIGRHARNHE